MNLHRSAGQPDWELVKEADRTSVQKLAAATWGLMTPPNAITVIGLIIVILGLISILEQSYWIGLLLLTAGRLMDIVDGLVADKTGTKSSVGEIFDAAADKVGTILTLIVILFANITSFWVIVALIIPQLVIPIISFYKKRKGRGVHPTRAGKLSMALTWVGIVGLIIVKALNDPLWLETIFYAVIGVSLVLGLYSLWQYMTNRD
jgi:CDP-diacylglycerol--glycerol-3-phosphate 3-phosphatidyltransferase